MRRIIAVLLAAVLLFGAVPVWAAETAGTGTSYGNVSSQDYTIHAAPVGSYLVETDGGYMTIMSPEYYDRDGEILILNFDAQFSRIGERRISKELPYFGGFFEGSDAYYLFFGQENLEERDDTEVIRIVKYSKDWKRLEQASIFGANTSDPFFWGSLRAAERDGFLYVRTSHRMYQMPDGLNHQENLTIQMRISDMEVMRAKSDVGFVGHSLNQFILVDDANNIITLDQGDGYPRGVALHKFYGAPGEDPLKMNYKGRINVLPFQGEIGENFTGANLGGLEYSGSHYLAAGSSVIQDENFRQYRVGNVFVTATPRDDFSTDGTQVRWITNYKEEGEETASAPQLVKIGADRFLLLWENGTGMVQYVYLNGAGEPTGPIQTGKGYLSDCKPLVKDGSAIWFVTDAGGLTTFYAVNRNGEFVEEKIVPIFPDETGGTFGEDQALRWQIDLNNVLTISGSGAIPNGEPWKKYTRTVRKAILQPGITGIGDSAFLNCSALESVEIPDSVTAIERWAFFGCSSLTGVTIPKSVTELEESVFASCTSLKRVTIPDSVKVIWEGAFSGCSALTEVSIPEGVTSIGSWAFLDCTALMNVTIPKSVTTIRTGAFGYFENDDFEDIPIDGFTVTGYTGTAAEEYAKKNGFKFVSLGAAEPEPTSYRPGDVTSDGKITSADALQIQRYVVKRSSVLDNAAKKVLDAADVTGDGYITSADALQIQRYVVQRPSVLDGK